MTRHSDNSIFFYPVDPGSSYRLTAEVEDGFCDDSFQILVAGELLYNYDASPSSNTRINAHIVTIPASAVTDTALEVTLRNTSKDSCGSAGVYNVELQRI